MASERVGITLDVLPGTMAGVTAALGGFNELVAATSVFSNAIAKSTSVVDSMMLTLGVGLVGAAWESSKAFGELERSMKIVQAVSGQTNSQIQVLTQSAGEFSTKYKLGIDDITAGLQTLGRAGLSNVNTQLDTMKAGLQAAKIQGMDLNDALEKIVQTTSLLGGNLKSSNFGQQTQELTSKLLSTAMTAPIDLNDVVQTLSYSGGTAAAAGIDIYHDDALYDYLGAISAFAQKGVTGSMAGTAMRAFFTKPASQDTSVTEALGRLDMKASDLWKDGGNAMRPVSEQIELIHNQMEKLNMSTLDQIELWGKIVGPKMGQQMMKLNADTIKETSNQIQQTASAEELAQTTMNNFLSDLSTLEQQAQKSWRSYGEAAIAWVGPVVKAVSGLFNLLGGANVGGIPIFQQIVKMGIILLISQIIQRLGAVKNLFVGIASEIKNVLATGARSKATIEEEAAAEKKRLESLGLTTKQAETLVNSEGKVASGLSVSNKVLAEFLVKLNEAVTLMQELATLSRTASMNTISTISSAQHNRAFMKDGTKNMIPTAWYSGMKGGDLTRNEFATLALRHGMNIDGKDGLLSIYKSSEFQQFWKNNQSSKSTFPTAISLEKYLQQKQMGMYDPKINPIMGIVSNIKTDTGAIVQGVKTKPPVNDKKIVNISDKSLNDKKSSKNNEQNKQNLIEKENTTETEKEKTEKKKRNAKEKEKTAETEKQSVLEKELTEIDEWCVQQAQAHAGLLNKTVSNKTKFVTEESNLDTQKINIVKQDNQAKEKGYLSQQKINQLYDEYIIYLNNQINKVGGFRSGYNGKYTLRNAQRRLGATREIDREEIVPYNKQYINQLTNWKKSALNPDTMGSAQALRNVIQKHKLRQEEALEYVNREVQELSEDVKYVEANRIERQKLVDKNKQEESVIIENIQTLEATKLLLIEEQNQLRARARQYKAQYDTYIYNATYGPKSKQSQYAQKAIALKESPEYINLKTAYQEQTNAINKVNSEIRQEQNLLKRTQATLNENIIQLNKAVAEDKAIANKKHHLEYAILKEVELRNELAVLDDLEVQLSKQTLSAHDKEVYFLNQKLNKHNEHISTLQNVLNRYLAEIEEQQQILSATTSARDALIARGASSKQIAKIDKEIEKATIRISNLKSEIISKEISINNAINRRDKVEKELLAKTESQNIVANALLKGNMAKFTSTMGFTGLGGAQLNQIYKYLNPFGMPAMLSSAQLSQIPRILGQNFVTQGLEAERFVANRLKGNQPMGVTVGTPKTLSTAMPGTLPSPTTLQNAQTIALQYEMHQSVIRTLLYQRGLEKALMEQDSAYRRIATIAQEEIGIKESNILALREQIALKREEVAKARNTQTSINTIASLERELASLESSKASQERTIEKLNSQIISAKAAALQRAGIGATGSGGVTPYYQTKGVAGNIASTQMMSRYGIPLGTVSASQLGAYNGSFNPGFWGAMRTGFFAGNPRGIEGGGKFWNWMQMGMTGMVDWGKIKEANASLGKLGKVGNIAGGALGSLGMMFGPFEVGMMAFSFGMQAVQQAQQNYAKELEKINSALSESKEKLQKAEEEYEKAYSDANPNATQEQKDEAYLNVYTNGPDRREDGLDQYRQQLYGTITQIEVNTRKKADKENDFWWGAQGGMQKNFWSNWDEFWGWAFDNSDQTIKNSMNEQFEVQRQGAYELGTRGRTSYEHAGSYKGILNNANDLESLEKDYFHVKDLDKTLNHYPNWVEDLEDYTEQGKYAASLMAQGIDKTGPTDRSEYAAYFGESGISEYKAFEDSFKSIPDKIKTQMTDSISADPEFYKRMQRIMWGSSKDGKLTRKDASTETKILNAIQKRVGNISKEQAQQTLVLATLADIHKVVQDQVQPTLMSNLDAAWSTVSVGSQTSSNTMGSWSTEAATQQGVAIISSQLATLVQQQSMETASTQAELAGFKMTDLDRLRQMSSASQLTETDRQLGYTQQTIDDAKTIFTAMEKAPYAAVLSMKGYTDEQINQITETAKTNLEKNGANGIAIINTQHKWLADQLKGVVSDEYLKALEETPAEATGAEDTDKDKDKNKNKDKDTSSNRKNWVNLAICNKKEIPKLNVNLFKKPPNFTILNRNFKLRDVNVNTADDAKSIQNAVKNSIIEIQNRSNPKIIQDDAAEYDPLSATEGNNLPVGTKKTE